MKTCKQSWELFLRIPITVTHWILLYHTRNIWALPLKFLWEIIKHVNSLAQSPVQNTSRKELGLKADRY